MRLTSGRYNHVYGPDTFVLKRKVRMMADERLNVLVLCTGNSCRSQMAEGWLNAHYGDTIHAFSAGSDPSGYVHPKAVEVMGEVGIDISAGRSKHMSEFIKQPFDYVLTVCDSAAEACPVFPGPGKRVHRDFFDPAKAEGDDEQVLAIFRRVRNEIKAWLDEIFETA
jgi:arsenate reductase